MGYKHLGAGPAGLSLLATDSATARRVLNKRTFFVGTGKFAVGALAAVGLVELIIFALAQSSVIKGPSEEIVYRSPGAGSTLAWSVFPGESSPRSLRFPQSGLSLFEARKFITSGRPYFARWTSYNAVEVFVSKDFALEGVSGDRFEEGEVSVSLRRLDLGGT